MNQTPTPATVIRRAFEAFMRGVGTFEPGVVTSYNATTGQADVQPLIMRLSTGESGDRIATTATPLSEIPVCFMGGGGMRLTFPCKAGDTGLILTASRSLERWRYLGGITDPQDNRHHHVSDSVFLCGLPNGDAAFTPAHATATVLEGSDIRLGDSSGGALATLADLAALISTFNGHVHVAPSGGGPTAVPTVPASSATGTTKVKAK